VFGFGDIATTEAVGVPDDDGFELAGLGVGDHVLEVGAFLGACAADGVVDVFADEFVSILIGMPGDLGSLARWSSMLCSCLSVERRR